MFLSNRPCAGLILILLVVTAVFAADLATPLGLGIPFLYLLALLLAIAGRQSNRVLVAIAVVCPALAGAKLLLAPAGGMSQFGEGNRLIFTLVTASVAGLELFRRHCEARLAAARHRFGQDLERQVEERTAALRKEVGERKQAERTARDYADRLVEVQEVERQRLAAELHDRIGQHLSALNLNLGLNLAQLPAEAPAAIRARIRDSLSLVEQTTEMVRGVMEELHPALLDQYGLDAALRWYGDEFCGRTGIAVAHEVPEAFPRLRPQVELAFFRIVQEALTNVAKHASATRVRLALARTAAGVELKVCDDGRGMSPPAPAHGGAGSGWGLRLMAERARSVGAGLEVESAAGRGTCIAVRIANGLRENGHADHRIDR